jgi:hypothetical protein
MPMIPIVPTIPSKLGLVNEALDALKQPRVTTLANAKPLILMLGNSVDDCVSDIYSRAAWRFRLRTQQIELVADEEFYSIPPDFGNIYSKGIQAKSLFIPYATADDFNATAVTPYGDGESPSGRPIMFTLWDYEFFRFYPKPDATFASLYPVLNLQYLCTAQPILNENESPILPYAFKLCVVNFLKYRWMASNEYGVTDMQEAKGMYEGQLALLLARNDPAPNGHGLRSGFSLKNNRALQAPDKASPFGGY